MIEIGVIGFAGGLIGLFLIMLGLQGIEYLYDSPAGLVRLDWLMVITAVTISIISSLVAGLYPAWRVCKIPPATQTGTIFRLKGKGIANLRGYGNGDQHIRIVVEIPEKLTREQKAFLEQFDSAKTDRQNPITTEFRNKVNDYYEK